MEFLYNPLGVLSPGSGAALKLRRFRSFFAAEYLGARFLQESQYLKCEIAPQGPWVSWLDSIVYVYHKLGIILESQAAEAPGGGHV